MGLVAEKHSVAIFLRTETLQPLLNGLLGFSIFNADELNRLRVVQLISQHMNTVLSQPLDDFVAMLTSFVIARTEENGHLELC